jgi:ABC-type transporter Mla MlaB component
MPTPGPHEVAFAIRGPLARADLPALCDRVCAILSSAAGATLVCGVESIRPDAVTVDALARLQLAARRCGCRILLRGATPQLLELVAFMGLANVLAERTQVSGESLREMLMT